MKTTLSPYLGFNGNCREAMEFYRSIFGGKLTMQTYGEAMPDGMPANYPDEEKKKIMHSTLEGDVITFMASDTQPGTTVMFGNSVSLCLAGDDEPQLSGYFHKLAEEGQVTLKLEKQFWGDIFGMVTDKFGIHWMVNIGSNGQA